MKSYEDVTTEFPVQYKPRLNIDYRYDSFRVFLLANRGATLPTFDQRYFSSASPLANPDLGLEKIYNLKLRVIHELANNLNYSIVPLSDQ